MTETFKAGSIQSDLKVETESLEKGFSFATKATELFGQRTKQTAENVDQAGADMAKTFDLLGQKSSDVSRVFQVRWNQQKTAVADAARTITAASSDMGVKFELLGRQNARLAQEFQARWKQNQAAAAGATAQITKGADAFGAIDRNSLRTTERFARLTNRLVGVQFAMQSLGSETTKGSKALEVGVKGLGIFASTAMLIPGPVGLAAGAILGLGVAFKAATAAGEDTVKVLENARTAAEAIETGRRERQLESEVEGRLGKLFPTQKDVQATKAVADQIGIIRRLTSEQLIVEKQLTALHERRKKINETLQDDTLGFKNEGIWGVIMQVVPGPMEARMARLTGELSDIDEELLKLQRSAPKAADELKKAMAELANVRFEEKLTAIDKSMTEFRDQTTLMQEGARFAADYLALRKELLQVEKDLNTTALNGKKGDQLTLLGNAAKNTAREAFQKRAGFMTEQGKRPIFEDLKQQRRAMELELTPLTRLQEVEEERKRTIEKIVELKRAEAFALNTTFEEEKAKAAAAEEVKKTFDEMKLLANQQDFSDMFAQPVSAGVFRGLAEGILEARKPLEVLAGIGENLFSNMVNSFASQLQKQVSGALTSLFGAGGSILGNLFTGLAGVAGLLLSRKKGSNDQSFDDIKGGIESSQAMRGIVAGPSSVSIAAVGADLRTALGPTEDYLRELVSLGHRMIRKMGGGSSGVQLAGGYPLPATVATQ